MIILVADIHRSCMIILVADIHRSCMIILVADIHRSCIHNNKLKKTHSLIFLAFKNDGNDKSY
jgi:hypothetical protein